MAQPRWVPCCPNCRTKLGNPPSREIMRLTDGRSLTRPCSCGTETAWEANLGRREPESPFGAREYAKALNLLLQLYNIATELRDTARTQHADSCSCERCKTFRAVHTFIHHGEG